MLDLPPSLAVGVHVAAHVHVPKGVEALPHGQAGHVHLPEPEGRGLDDGPGVALKVVHLGGLAVMKAVRYQAAGDDQPLGSFVVNPKLELE